MPQDTTKGYTAAEQQMRKNLHQTLNKRTKVLINEFVDARQRHTEANKARMKRQVDIVLGGTETLNPETKQPYTEEEKEKVAIQCYETGTSPFMEALAGNTLRGELTCHILRWLVVG
jgi:hypothetical protein